jgi:hypothetical protein
VGNFALVVGVKGEIVESAVAKAEKHLHACFPRDFSFAVALAIKSCGGFSNKRVRASIISLVSWL